MHQTHTHTCCTVINQYMIQCGTSQFINIILYHYKPIIDRTFNLLARRPQWRSPGYAHIIHQLWPGSRNIKHAGSFKTLSYQGKSMEICFLQGPPNQNPPRRHPCNQSYRWSRGQSTAGKIETTQVALSNLWKVLFDNSKRDGISLRPPPPPMEFHFHDHRQLEVGIKERKIGTSLQDYQTLVKHMWCGVVRKR